MGEEAGGSVLAETAAIETGAIEGTPTGENETAGVGASGEPPPSAFRA
jgi:hypothetical protein